MSTATTLQPLTDVIDPQDPITLLGPKSGLAGDGPAGLMTLLSKTVKRLASAEQRIAEQQRRIRELEALAITDELTGLNNRRGFIRLFEREAARLSRNPRSRGGALALCDLDGFKPINDRHGHAAGDACLKAVGKALEGCVRGADIVGRIGGDEFAILLNDISPADARRRLNLIWERLNGLIVPWEGQQIFVRASLGATFFGPADLDLGLLMSAADAELYRAKGLRLQMRETAAA